MKKLKLIAAVFFCLAVFPNEYLNAQSRWMPTQGFDILHYDFSLEFFEESDLLKGKAQIFVDQMEDAKGKLLTLDLIGKEEEQSKFGMKVKEVSYRTHAIPFTHEKDKLILELPADFQKEYPLQVNYEGIPADGMIISKNKYGERTYFGDNWPNRGRNWLSCSRSPL